MQVFFWNKDISINNHLQHEKERLPRKIFRFLLLNAIWMENFTHRWSQSGHFFSNLGHSFPIFEKGRGRPLPVPSSSNAPDLEPKIQIDSKSNPSLLRTLTIPRISPRKRKVGVDDLVLFQAADRIVHIHSISEQNSSESFTFKRLHISVQLFSLKCNEETILAVQVKVG